AAAISLFVTSAICLRNVPIRRSVRAWRGRTRPFWLHRGAWAPVRRPSGAVRNAKAPNQRPTGRCTGATPEAIAILFEVPPRTRPQGARMANVADVTDNNFQAE